MLLVKEIRVLADRHLRHRARNGNSNLFPLPFARDGSLARSAANSVSLTT